MQLFDRFDYSQRGGTKLVLTGLGLDRAISRYNFIANPETVLTSTPSFGCLVQVLTICVFNSLKQIEHEYNDALIRFVRRDRRNQVIRSRRH